MRVTYVFNNSQYLHLVYYRYNKYILDFEFNKSKSEVNKQKHGIDFNEAKQLWDDPDHVEIPVKTSDEPRFLIDLSKLKRPKQDQKRVNVDFPLWMIDLLDKEAKRLGVPRQSIIKVWVAGRLENAAPLSTLINDVIVTHEAAYFTDSFAAFLYRVPLGLPT